MLLKTSFLKYFVVSGLRATICLKQFQSWCRFGFQGLSELDATGESLNKIYSITSSPSALRYSSVLSVLDSF